MWVAVVSTVSGVIAGIFIGALIEASAHDDSAERLQHRNRMSELKWQTVEAWGVGYQNGFNDSRLICLEALRQQQEMMREHLEHTPQKLDSTAGSGTDRDGITITRPGSAEVSQATD